MNRAKMGLVNPYWIGDTVILEPVASLMREEIDVEPFIISHYPELYVGHPSITGLNINETIDKSITLIDLKEYINPVDKENKLKDKKLDLIYRVCGLLPQQKREPKLYLTNEELTKLNFLQRTKHRKTVGVVLSSRSVSKDWNPFMSRVLVEKLVKDGYDTYIIGKDISDRFYDSMPVKKLVDLPLRDLMIWLSYLDLVVAPDTGISHMANALGTQTVVVALPAFSELYEYYTRCNIIKVKEDNKTDLMQVSHRQIIDRIKKIEIKDVQKKDVLIVRFRGLGDVLLLLPAVATLKKQYQDRKYTLLTNSVLAPIIKEASTVFDDVIGMDYDHWSSGEPPLPSTFDAKNYDVVINLINRVDFITDSDKAHRSLLFANKLGLQDVDFKTDWKLHIPFEWLIDIRRKLLSKAGMLRRKLIVIQVDSKGASRIYPKERMKELIGKFIKYYDVVLTSDTKVQAYSGNAINLTGELNLKEYISLIAECDLFVGTDSSGCHIAGCVGKKAIGLYGSVDPKYRVSHYATVYPMIGKCKHQPCNDWQKENCSKWDRPLECLWSLLPRDIFAKAKELLSMGE